MRNNPIGSRNYVAWFQTGWLRWKFHDSIEAAEEAFYQAARLSAPEANLYHVCSLRHLAYMQSLQNRFSKAFDNAYKASTVDPDNPELLYDVARYAARTGRNSEALRALGKCIDIQPQTIVTMFAERDFTS